MTVRARATKLSFLLVVALGACGSSGNSDGGGDGGCNLTPSRSPTAGEGTLCTPPGDGGGSSNCPDGLSCVNWSPYGGSTFYVCRTPCSPGCPTGETCTPDVGSSTSQSCQCASGNEPCAADDSCVSIGLECHPDFHVCLAPVSSTSCTAQLRYSSLWQLCLTD